MKKQRIIFAICFMTATIAFGGFGNISMAASANIPLPVDSDQKDTSSIETDKDENIAIAQVSDDAYVNIRDEANAKNGKVLGKLYNNAVATILGQEDDWYLIKSGTVTGYVKKTHFVTGSQAKDLIQQVGQEYATVGSKSLMVRSDASNNADVICMVGDAARLPIVEDLGDWVKVAVDSDVVGYVPKDYVNCETEFVEAESKEEEAVKIAEAEAIYQASMAEAKKADEEAVQEDAIQPEANEQYLEAAAQEAADQAEADAQADADAQKAADEQYQAEAEAQEAQDRGYPTPEYSGNTSYNQGQQFGDVYGSNTFNGSNWIPTSSGMRQSVVSFALQFVGNPYVWGGTSLTNGADCSGFTQSVMANFGISIPRVAQDQAGSGRDVALSDIQPGDLLFYNGDGEIGHVSMYIGNNQVVHASSSTTGIIVSDLGYRQACSARSYID